MIQWLKDVKAVVDRCTFGQKPVPHKRYVHELLKEWRLEDCPTLELTSELSAQVNPNRLVGFYRFMFDRHNIWHKRFALEQPAPWTTDPILGKWKFTNVYRELDRGTVYLTDWLREHSCIACRYNEFAYLGIPKANVTGRDMCPMQPETVLWNIMLYRLFNNWQAHKALGGFHSWKDFHYASWYKDLRERWAAGDTVLSTAHNTCVYSGFPGEDKVERVCLIAKTVHKMIPTLVKSVQNAPSLEGVFEVINAVPGYGPFLAYEVVTDLTYTGLIEHSINDWANAGPGATRGLQHIFPGKHGIPLNTLMQYLRILQEVYFEAVVEVFGSEYDFEKIAWNGRPLDLRCIEHSLCEFSKIVKLYAGTGRNFSGYFKPVDRGAADFENMKRRPS